MLETSNAATIILLRFQPCVVDGDTLCRQPFDFCHPLNLVMPHDLQVKVKYANRVNDWKKRNDEYRSMLLEQSAQQHHIRNPNELMSSIEMDSTSQRMIKTKTLVVSCSHKNLTSQLPYTSFIRTTRQSKNPQRVKF